MLMRYIDVITEGKLGSFSAYVISLTEDHEKVMTETEMTSYITKLYGKSTDDNRASFLSALSKASGIKDCTDKDISSCAKKICSGDKKACDSIIHKLESIVGYKMRIK